MREYVTRFRGREIDSAVHSHEVVAPRDPSDGWRPAETGVRSVEVVAVKPAGQPSPTLSMPPPTSIASAISPNRVFVYSPPLAPTHETRLGSVSLGCEPYEMSGHRCRPRLE